MLVINRQNLSENPGMEVTAHKRWGVSFHLPIGCLFKSIFRPTSKKSKLCITGSTCWNPSTTGGFLAQRASNVEKCAMTWRHDRELIQSGKTPKTAEHSDTKLTVHTPYLALVGWVIRWKYFRVAGLLWGEFTGHRWIPLPKPVTRFFAVCFALRLNKRLSTQSRRRWYEAPSRSLWRQCNGMWPCYTVVTL